MYDDMPMRRVSDVFDELMFGGSNLAGDVLGEKETISSLNRDNFLSYIGEWYGFKNITIVVAGDDGVVGAEDLQSKIEEYFSKGGQERQSRAQEEFWQENQVYGSDRQRVINKETEQAHFILGFPSFPRKDDRKYSLSLLSTLLGRTMSSRLFTEIRDNRGLCYYIRTGTDFYHDGGALTASAGVDPHRIQEAIAATKQEFLQLLSTKPITQKELQSAKQNMIGGLLLELEDTQSVAYWYGLRSLLEGKIQTDQEVIAKLEQVTLEQVHEVAHEIIKEDQMRLALIGPYQPDDIQV